MSNEDRKTVWGYQLRDKKDECSYHSFMHQPTGPLESLYPLRSEIAILILAAEKSVKINEPEIRKIERLTGISYSGFTQSQIISFLKKDGAPVYQKQAIVALVSSWEHYFSGICRTIFNDFKTVKNLHKHKEKELKRFLEHMKFHDMLRCVKCKSDVPCNLGNEMFESTKLNFQSIENVKLFCKLFYNCKLPTSDTRWNNFTLLFETRHVIVHKPGGHIPSKKIFQPMKENGYDFVWEWWTPERLTGTMLFMNEILWNIDEILFTKYEKQLNNHL